MVFFLEFFVFNQPTAHCSNPYLKTHIIGGHIAYFCGDITYSNAFDVIKYIKYNQLNNLNYNIYTPNKFCINTLPYKHPYRHPHLNILQYNNLFNDIYVNIQMSKHNFNNCHLLSKKLIYGKGEGQYIANNFYFYHKYEIEKYFHNYNINNNNNYIYKYEENINKHINNVKGKYKI